VDAGRLDVVDHPVSRQIRTLRVSVDS
jgi:hypothetical protein